MSTCIGCGCTDEHACPGGCSWLRVDSVDAHAGLGVCSNCVEHIDRWEAGDRTLNPRSVIDPHDLLAMVMHRMGTAHVVLRAPDITAVLNKIIHLHEDGDELHVRLLDADDPIQSERFLETRASLLVDPTGAPFERAMDAVAHRRGRS